MLFPNENSVKKTKDEFQRLSTVEFNDSSQRFQMKEHQMDFNKQFAHIYARRLDQMRPLLGDKAKEKWGKKKKSKNFNKP